MGRKRVSQVEATVDTSVMGYRESGGSFYINSFLIISSFLNISFLFYFVKETKFQD